MNRITSLVLAGSGLLKKHSPAILTGVAVVGVVTTTVMAAKAAQRSKAIVDQYVDQDAEQPVETPDILTKAKLTWKIWLPTVSSGAMTITAIVMANRIQSKRLALAIGAYSLAEAALNEFTEATEEHAGKDVVDKIRDGIAQKKVSEHDYTDTDIVMENGPTLCYDIWTGRYFKSDVENLNRAVNRVNQRLLCDTWMSLNELYSEIGLDQVRIGDGLGWTPDRIIELDIRAMVANDKTPVLVLDYAYPPKVYPYN